ncbi:MAG: hypothetical protein A2177_05955 [Spirochaetes bacterium RBG_13_68_11]|nr:MAG: hypothetical protein A2177_05955 [Spirochaetes bacterium RBG_13_68_11]
MTPSTEGKGSGVVEELPAESHSDVRADEPEVLEEEKRQILEQIERSVAEAITPPPEEQLPRNKGLVFPLFVNLAALIVVTGVILGSVQLFQVRQERLDEETRNYASAEGKILDEFRRESEEKLRDKDAAILRVLKQLGTLETEREQLDQMMELRMRDKERELRESLAAELEAEEQVLRLAGASSEAVEKRLKDLETERMRSLVEELRLFQEQIDSQTRARELELLQEKENARLSLEKATQEREKLLQDAQKQEAALRSQLATGAKQGTAAGGAAKAIAEEETLLARERLVTDQIAAAYLLVCDALASGRYPEATRELVVLKTLFQIEDITGLPSVQRRRESDLKIITALEAFVVIATTPGPPAESARSAPLVEPADTAGVAATARAGAYEDILSLISRFEAADNQASWEALQKEIAQRSSREPVVGQLLQAIQGLAAGAEPLSPRSEETFRVLGTVTLARSDSVTILPAVDLTVETGARVEIRRILPTGKSVVVARATITEVQPGKLVARIDSLEGRLVPSVSDKVYLLVE